MEVLLTFLRRFYYFPGTWGLTLAVLVWLAAPGVQAQIIYVSDSRSTSAALGLNTNSLSGGGIFSVTYSGDYSGSASPTAPYADFNGSLSGGVNATVTYKSTSNSYSGSVFATQVSSLGSQGITYSSGVGENDNFPNISTINLVDQSSYLQVSFMVATATAYNLTCTRGNDPLFSSETWTLNSANLGNLVSGPPSVFPGGGPAEGTFNYSGMFSPGDVYTLTLREGGGIHGGAPLVSGEVGYLDVSLAIPEPSSSLLLGMGLVCFIAVRYGRKSGRRFRLARIATNGSR